MKDLPKKDSKKKLRLGIATQPYAHALKGQTILY